MQPFTLALAQIQTRLANPIANLETHLESIASARRQGADLVVFPELSLTGYLLQDAAEDVAIAATAAEPVFQELTRAAGKMDLVVGFVERDPRQRRFISAAYLSGGQILHVHRKVYLPTYGLFQDGRFFAAGEAFQAFDTRFGRLGLLICEDFWHVSSPYLLWLDGADVLLLTSASPGRGLNGEGRLESAETISRIAETYASLFTVFVAQTNRVGFEDGLCYWGGASVVGPDGRRLAQAPDFEEALLLTQIEPDSIRRARARLPLLRDERREVVARALGRILQQVSP